MGTHSDKKQSDCSVLKYTLSSLSFPFFFLIFQLIFFSLFPFNFDLSGLSISHLSETNALILILESDNTILYFRKWH